MFLSFFVVSCNKTEKRKPNFIFILADNLGYGDLGCYGSKIHKTPNIDKLAEEGIKLTSLYSSSGVCTPSRASLLTGSYAQRVDMHINAEGGWVLFPVSSKGLNPDETTIAEFLKEEGYMTACIGKWHLGDQLEFLPLNHGFDYFYGIPYSEDMDPSINPNWPFVPLLKNNEVIESPVDLTTTTKRYVEEAKNFIFKNRKNPFFLYFPHNLPGSRRIPIIGDSFQEKSSNGPWGDAVEEIDWSVGQIINYIKELGIEENTFVVFTSDNGAPQGLAGSSIGGSNEPFSGPGYSTKEGGMRVPCLVKWPGKIKGGETKNELCTMMDWLPTFSYLAGNSTHQNGLIDGKNIWPILSGQSYNKSPHEAFYYYFVDQLQAIRVDNWKLHLSTYNTDGYDRSKLKLVDLNNDLKEELDLSNEYPEIVNDLVEIAKKVRKELGDTDLIGSQLRHAGYIKNPKPLIKN